MLDEPLHIIERLALHASCGILSYPRLGLQYARDPSDPTFHTSVMAMLVSGLVMYLTRDVSPLYRHDGDQWPPRDTAAPSDTFHPHNEILEDPGPGHVTQRPISVRLFIYSMLLRELFLSKAVWKLENHGAACMDKVGTLAST
jgi:hypothetical protein